MVGKALDEQEMINSSTRSAAQSASNSEEEVEDDKGLTNLYEIRYLEIITHVVFLSSLPNVLKIPMTFVRLSVEI